MGGIYIPRTGEGLGASLPMGSAPGSASGHALSVTFSEIHFYEMCRIGRSVKTKGGGWGVRDTEADCECIY